VLSNLVAFSADGQGHWKPRSSSVCGRNLGNEGQIVRKEIGGKDPGDPRPASGGKAGKVGIERRWPGHPSEKTPQGKKGGADTISIGPNGEEGMGMLKTKETCRHEHVNCTSPD